MTFFLMFLGLVALILIDVPIAIALGVVAVVAMVASSGAVVIPNVALILFDGVTKFPLIAIPLFILAGAIMNASGISRRLVAFASALFGSIRGGLAMVSIGASLFFAEISGSAVADVAALGTILIPAMKRKGYSTPFAAAVTSSSATLAVIIPPSIPMILYAVMSGASVVELFVAGIIPGIIGGVLMMAVAYALALRHDFHVVIPDHEELAAVARCVIDVRCVHVAARAVEQEGQGGECEPDHDGGRSLHPAACSARSFERE